ncbi:MAG TPA: cupredoxin domain-containing protein [Bacillota bacterium]
MQAARLIAGTLAMTVLLAALALWRAGAGDLPGAQTRTIEVTARQFAYEPSIIRVDAGERVRLVLTSVDVAHSLAIREYGVHLTATPGDPASAAFTADRPGRFVMYCTVYCGTGHPEHVGALIVGAGEEGDRP